jgi:pyruvate,water dikinase
VVRSSSTAEDLADSSMAGRFASVLGVVGWDAFLGAVATVLASRAEAAAGDPRLAVDHPIAVLVQPELEAARGGVLFGVDPVSGRADRLVAAVVAGSPAPLVSGEVDGDRYELDRSGRVVHARRGRGGAELSARDRRALVALARRAADTFGGPQDVEWALDRAGALWLLQSRPVTTPVAGVPTGPLLGPGPVAETFPEPLSRLEEALWVPPLRGALRTAFELVGTAPPGVLDASPMVVAVDGRVAVDLDLFGDVAAVPGRWAALDPRPRIRRLRAAWRVGRLRAALPGLAEDLVQRTDGELLAVPALGELTDRQLLALLDRSGEALRAVHGHEVLLGLLVSRSAPRFTGAAVALRMLASARAAGVPEAEIAVRHPVVLALVPPRVQPSPSLPAVAAGPDWAPVPKGDAAALLREALRLRARWLQELGGRAAWELGVRLADRGVLGDPAAVRDMGLDDVTALVTGRAVLWRPGRRPVADLPPLPARFRLTGSGFPVAVHTGNPHPGSGAGGGRGRGAVHSGDGAPPPGSVLVVRTLDPTIAPHLGNLAGLVSETGSVLAHLAILAREARVPTVVGVDEALDRFPPGTVVTVDGTTGEVTVEEEVAG